MLTTKIQITPYLAEYIRGKYNNGADGPVTLPDKLDLYHAIWDLMARRPAHISGKDEGNLEIVLPNRRVGKDPATYNYLSKRSQELLERRIKTMFDVELHEKIDENAVKKYRLTRIDIVHQFLCSYGINSITEDALLKNYYRWRNNMTRREKRAYRKKKLNTT